MLEWFKAWERHILQTDGKNNRQLLSFQTSEDIVFCLMRFQELCCDIFKRSHGSIVPARINSDPIENIFSQQRGLHNGVNSNQDYLLYCRATNAVIIGEKVVSRKSNAGALMLPCQNSNTETSKHQQ